MYSLLVCIPVYTFPILSPPLCNNVLICFVNIFENVVKRMISPKVLFIIIIRSLHLVYAYVVPAGSPFRGGDVTVYVTDVNQPSLAPPFLFCSGVCFCLYSPFNCISFHKFSRQLSAFSLCSSGLISALVVLSNIYLFIKVSLSPDVILCG